MEKPTFIPTQRLEDEQHGVIYASNIEILFYTFDSNLEPFYHWVLYWVDPYSQTSTFTTGAFVSTLANLQMLGLNHFHYESMKF